MVTLMSLQARREGLVQGNDDGVVDRNATSWFPAALGLAGLATASSAITAAMSKPPPALQGTNGSYYLLALSGLFYAGIAELGGAVWVMADPRARAAVGRRLVYASLAPLAAAAGLAAATLLW
ncbi:hypothetical protein SETIT_5G100400v2 [Setaria italica]|uniref:Uncharacterized protein n=1 Tax=Setaria italica TaxID=4555 RepID=K3XPI6_SETIT|nr:hypothetical protein SETIT_5G100400v2 [Setaria italica]